MQYINYNLVKRYIQIKLFCQLLHDMVVILIFSILCRVFNGVEINFLKFIVNEKYRDWQLVLGLYQTPYTIAIQYKVCISFKNNIHINNIANYSTYLMIQNINLKICIHWYTAHGRSVPCTSILIIF